MFDKVTIIGFGLIGSSIARSLKHNSLAKTIACGDLSEPVCQKVLELDLADTATTDLAESVKDSDLVIMAVPVGVCGDVAKAIAPALKEGAIVTDTGSVKESVIKAVTRHLPDHADFIAGHPIAGTEHSGPEAGFHELFIGRWAILTPTVDSNPRALEKITKLWEAMGSTVELMNAQRHDLTLGITSHLPHIIAYTIVGTATDLEQHLQDDVVKFSASGFRDFTRIAASNPVMWRDIFLNNKDSVLEILQRFTEDLTALQRAIRWDDGEYLYNMFMRTRDIRRAIVDAKQADYTRPHRNDETVPEPEAPTKLEETGT